MLVIKEKKNLKKSKNLPHIVSYSNKIPIFKYSQKIFRDSQDAEQKTDWWTDYWLTEDLKVDTRQVKETKERRFTSKFLKMHSCSTSLQSSAFAGLRD